MSSRIIRSGKIILVHSIFPAVGSILCATPEKPNFQDDVFPIFEQSCNSCHNPDRARGGLDLTSMTAILAGGSSGDSVVPGEGANSYLYKLVAHLEKPYMPREKDKLPKNQIDLIKKWIDMGLLPTATGKAIAKKKSSLNLTLADAPTGKPEGPPPMPQYLSLQPNTSTKRPAANSAMAANPWSPLIAISGQKQVILYNTDTLQILGLLPYPEGFVESLNFSRNGLLLLAGGGRGGKVGKVAAWNTRSGRRVLTLGDEYDTILTSDISADQTKVAIGGPSKRIKVYDLASGEILHNIKKHSEWVTAVAFSPDGILLATGDRNGGLFVWEAQSGNLFYTLNGHKQEITSLSWRADSNMLASASEEGTVRTWEMFNGRQVRSTTAHGGGTLSVDFDKKGNLVTSGRDRTVKIWNTSGAATRTISGFGEMVMEARYSHDGTRIIAGDWNGVVSVWNVADGKKIGELSGNPPTIESQLATADKLQSERQTTLNAARTAHAPFKEKLAAAIANLAKAKETSAHAASALATADAALKTAQASLTKAIADRDLAAKEKASMQSDRDLKNKQLVDTQNQQKSNKKQSDEWEKRSSFRSEQISMLREALRKAKEALAAIPDDASFRQAVAKQEEALTAMDQSFVQSRSKMSELLAKAKTLTKESVTRKAALDAAEKALQSAIATLTQKEKARVASESSLKATQADMTTKTQTKKVADAALAQKTKEHASALAAEKAPAANIAKAESEFADAKASVARWRAETINLKRHDELKRLDDLENELQALDSLAEEAKSLHGIALAALEKAKKALEEIPAKIKAGEQTLAQRQAEMNAEEKALQEGQKKTTDKETFLNNVNSLADSTKAKAESEKGNVDLAAAAVKFAETLALLQKDLANAKEGIGSQQAKLKSAQDATSAAQAELEKIKSLSQTAPKVVEQKQSATKGTQEKLDETSRNRDSFKVQVTSQKAKADALLKQYLETLPK